MVQSIGGSGGSGGIEELEVRFKANTADFLNGVNKVNGGFRNFILGLTRGQDVVKKQQAEVQKLAADYRKLAEDIQRSKFSAANARGTPQQAQAFESYKKTLNDVIPQTDTLNSKLNDTKRTLGSFSGPLLSILFFGMQLNRTFTAALTSIFEGYKKIIPEGHAFNRLTTQLSANWEFFKYQLADVMANSPLFQTMVMSAIGLLKAFQGLPAPMKTFIVWGLVFASVLTGILFLTGVFGLGLLGITEILALVGIELGTVVASTKAWSIATFTTAAGFKALLGSLMTIALIIGIVYLGFKAASWLINKFIVDDGKKLEGFWNNLFAIVSTFVSGIINIFVLVIGAVVTVVMAIIQIWKVGFQAIGRLAGSFGRAIMAAIKAGIRGDDWKSAFVNAFDAKGLVEGFVSDFKDGLNTVGETATKVMDITKDVSDWNSNYVNSMATTITDESAGTGTTVYNTNIMTFEEAQSSGKVESESYNKFIDELNKMGY